MRWRGISSQQELARLSGVSQSCIHRILTRGDGYSPKRTTLLALARALDTTAVWLSDGIEFAHPVGSALRSGTSPGISTSTSPGISTSTSPGTSASTSPGKGTSTKPSTSASTSTSTSTSHSRSASASSPRLNDAGNGTRYPAYAYVTESAAAPAPATRDAALAPLDTIAALTPTPTTPPSTRQQCDQAEIERLVRTLTPAERSALLPLLRLIVKASAAPARVRSP